MKLHTILVNLFYGYKIRGSLAISQEILYVVLRGESHLKRTQATAEMDWFGDAPRKNAVTRIRLELEVGSKILISFNSAAGH